MRLDKLTIGSPKDSATHQFKNLKNVVVDFDQDHWVTVMIGWNGTGKSNVLEALAIIFRDLIMSKRAPAFAYNLAYCIGSGDAVRHVHIDADPDRPDDPYVIHFATDAEARGTNTLVPFLEDEPVISALRGQRIRPTQFLRRSDEFLPRYVFSYYSGESQRMADVFRPYLDGYDKDLRNGNDPGLKRLFYALPVHSQFVLLAFLIQQTDVVQKFLSDHLGIDPVDGIESVLFVLREPPWAKSKAQGGDFRFWNAKGVVADFLARLFDVALAPIEVERNVPVSPWNNKKIEFKYLFVKDIDALRQLVGEQTPAQFFRDLESTYVSELIEEVRIRIRIKDADGGVTFRELSEGERQLLTVLGLLRFTSREESLLLLDEPDTHLNPRWQYDFLELIQQVATTNDDRSHLILTTHNPLVIGGLRKEQVRLLGRGESEQIEVVEPNDDPIGVGIEGLLKSELFGLRSSLAHEVLEKIDRHYQLLGMSNRTIEEDNEARSLASELNSLGIAQTHPNPYFEEFAKAMVRTAPNVAGDISRQEIEEQSELADSVLRELLEEGRAKTVGEQA